MSLIPDVVRKAKDFDKHEAILDLFISAIKNKADRSVLDLMINFVYELETVRTQLLQEYTNEFVRVDSCMASFEERYKYERFTEFISTLNMMRCLCKEELRALGLNFEACDSKVLRC